MAPCDTSIWMVNHPSNRSQRPRKKERTRQDKNNHKGGGGKKASGQACLLMLPSKPSTTCKWFSLIEANIMVYSMQQNLRIFRNKRKIQMTQMFISWFLQFNAPISNLILLLSTRMLLYGQTLIPHNYSQPNTEHGHTWKKQSQIDRQLMQALRIADTQNYSAPDSPEEQNLEKVKMMHLFAELSK